MPSPRRSKRLAKNTDDQDSLNDSTLDDQGTSEKSPYLVAWEQLEEVSISDSSFITAGEDEYEVTQNDEDGLVGVRYIRPSPSASPRARRRKELAVEDRRYQSTSWNRDESVSTDDEADSFWGLYRQISNHVNAYKHRYMIGLTLLIILILFSVAVYHAKAYWRAQKFKDPDFEYEKFKKRSNELFNGYPNQRNLKIIIYHVGHQLIHVNKADPIFIIVAGSNEKQLTGFVQNFETLMKDYKRLEIINLTNLSSRKELNANIMKILESTEGVILHRIDKLRGDAPQVLHAMSDVETSPHKNSILLGTIELPKPIEIPEECTYSVQNYLENEWISEKLPLNQLSAILSRITSFTICIV